MKPVLEVTGLRIERGNTTILRDVNWRVVPGEHWVILGANGSGKTSLLKALTGFLSPTDGEFSVLGRRYGAADWRELRLHIGVVTSAFTASIPLSEVTLDTVISGKYAQLDLWHAGTRADRVAALQLGRGRIRRCTGRALSLLDERGERRGRIGTDSVGRGWALGARKRSLLGARKTGNVGARDRVAGGKARQSEHGEGQAAGDGPAPGVFEADLFGDRHGTSRASGQHADRTLR